MTILVLAGTTEGRDLATALVAEVGEQNVLTSLAGRTAAPVLPPGPVRRGGFGGAQALAAFITANAITCVVDATHPFARQIATNAAQACAATGCRHVRLERPTWQPQPGDDWRHVPDIAAAAAYVAELPPSRIFLATGSTDLGPATGTHWVLRRLVDRPDTRPDNRLPADHHAIFARGPFHVAAETKLLRDHRIDLVVCKASGGDSGAAKLTAARDLSLPVLMIDRPPPPDGPHVGSVSQVLQWLNREGVTPMRPIVAADGP